jgi:hypothetical protein
MEAFLRISPRVLISDAVRRDEPNELRRWIVLQIVVIHRYGRDSFPRLGLIYAWRVGFFHQSAEQFVIQHSRDLIFFQA